MDKVNGILERTEIGGLKMIKRYFTYLIISCIMCSIIAIYGYICSISETATLSWLFVLIITGLVYCILFFIK